MEVKSKLLVFSPVPSVIQIIQKVESVNTQSNCKTTYKKDNRLVQCVYTLWKSTKRWKSLKHHMITKQVQNEQIKRK